MLTYQVQCVPSAALSPAPEELGAGENDTIGANTTELDVIGEQDKPKKPYTGWWRHPECDDFGREPQDEPGWDFEHVPQAYCECRRKSLYYWCQVSLAPCRRGLQSSLCDAAVKIAIRRRYLGTDMQPDQMAIPNDHVIDTRQVKEAQGDHWECGQSVLKSIGVLLGGKPARKTMLLSHVSPPLFPRAHCLWRLRLSAIKPKQSWKSLIQSQEQTCYVRFRQMLVGVPNGKARRLEKINTAFHKGTCNAFRSVNCKDLGDHEPEEKINLDNKCDDEEW